MGNQSNCIGALGSAQRNNDVLDLLGKTTAIAGMNGVKQLMVFHAPLCIAAAILLVLALHDSGTSDWKTALQHCRRQVRLFAASLVTAVAGAAGYFISNSVMSRLYDF